MQENKLNTQKNTSQYTNYLNKDLKEWDLLQKPQNEYDVSVYSTPFEKSGVNLTRVLFTMQNVTLKACSQCFGKITEEMIKEESSVKDFRIIEETNNTQIIYQRISPPIITDRELVLLMSSEQIGDVIKITSQSIEHSDFPENKKYVRAEQFRQTSLKQVGSDVQLEQIAFFDMKGSIPKSVLNKMMVDKIKKSLIKKYQIIQKLNQE